MPPETFVILAADPATGDLVITKGGTAEVEKGDSVIWLIGDTVTTVKSFQILKKHWYTHNIFVKPPGQEEANNVKMRVKPDALFNWKYKYSIIWTDRYGQPHEHDPIISIKPSTNNDIFVIIGLVLATMLGIFGFKKWKKS